MLRKANVFISYSRRDQAFAQKLVTGLKDSQVGVWVDEVMTAAEHNFQERITRAIREADAVIVLWSSNSIKSQWVQAEAERAHSTRKLLQCRLDDCEMLVPYNIQQRQDLFDWNGDKDHPAFKRLLIAIEELVESRWAERKELADDPQTNQLKTYLKEELKIDLIELIASGDLSTVYLGSDGWRQYAVKLVPESSRDKEDIDREVLLTSQLYNPSFMRIVDVTFNGHDCIIVSDYAPARHLGSMLEERQKKTSGQPGGGPFEPEVVIDVMRQLSEALTEAHYRGLRYTRVSPREIYMLEDFMLEDAKEEDSTIEQSRRLRPLLSPINFAYRSELVKHYRVDFTPERGPYTAPEILNEEDKLLNRDDWRQVLQRADQFSLGMVAWAMLEGKTPFEYTKPNEGRVDRLKRFYDVEVPAFEARVKDADWRKGARALVPIIARMVAAKPADRWPDMKTVSRLFAALDADHDGEYLRNIVKQLYAEHCHEPTGELRTKFYETFYERLFEDNPEARAVFSAHGITDLAGQVAKLDLALHQLLNYNQSQREPTPLTDIFTRHADLGLTKASYKAFGKALINTFASFIGLNDKNREMKLAALDVVIWPAVYYFIPEPRVV